MKKDVQSKDILCTVVLGIIGFGSLFVLLISSILAVL